MVSKVPCLLVAIAFCLLANVYANSLTCLTFLENMYHNPQKYIANFIASGKGYNDFGDPHLCSFMKDTRYVLANFKLFHNLYLTAFIGFCGPSHCGPEDYAAYVGPVKALITRQTNISMDILDVEFFDPIIENAKLKDFDISTWMMVIITLLLIAMGCFGSYLDRADEKQKLRDSGPRNIELSNQNQPIDLNQPQSHTQERQAGADPLLEAQPKREPRWKSVVKCFSFYSNLPKILSLDSKPGRTNIFSGIRVLSLTYIILGHTCYYQTRGPITNPYEYLYWAFLPQITLILTGPNFVDNFLFIGGFLSIYGRQEEAKTYGRVRVLGSYIHRTLRIMPLYMFILFYFWKVQAIFSDGVAGFYYKKIMDYECNDTWWTNALFLNNELPRDNIASCMGYTWYLAIDMQMFLVTPFLFNFYLKKRSAGWIITALLTLFSLVYCFVITYIYNVSPVAAEQFVNPSIYYKYYYIQPFARFASYGFGVMLAFFLMEYEEDHPTAITRLIVNSYKKKWFRTLCWIIAFLIFASVTLLISPINITLGDMSQSLKSGYFLYSRFGWPFLLCLITLPCFLGHAETLTKFLSARIWTPLARLSFAGYLVHPSIMFWYNWNLNQAHMGQMLRAIEEFFGFWVMTMILSCSASLLAESPGMNLEKLLLRRKTGGAPPKKEPLMETHVPKAI